MQVLPCTIITINTLNSKKIHIKYDPQVQSILTIWKWFFNEFKYKCESYSEHNFKFVDESNKTIPITNSIETTKEITEKTKKFKLILKPVAKSSQCANVEYNPDKFKESANSVRIYLQTLSGKPIVVYLNDLSNITVEELKMHIFENEGTPPDQLRLIFSGKQLEDENTLANCKITLDSTIHIVLRLRGGMFNEISGQNGAYKELSENFYDITNYVTDLSLY